MSVPSSTRRASPRLAHHHHHPHHHATTSASSPPAKKLSSSSSSVPVSRSPSPHWKGRAPPRVAVPSPPRSFATPTIDVSPRTADLIAEVNDDLAELAHAIAIPPLRDGLARALRKGNEEQELLFVEAVGDWKTLHTSMHFVIHSLHHSCLTA
jgi:hypothetical protein